MRTNINIKQKRIDEFIEKLSEKNDMAIYARLRWISFSKALLYICQRVKKDLSITPRDLADFLKTSYSRAYEILRNMENLGLIYREVGDYVFYHPIKNNDKPKILKFERVALNKLGWKER